MILKTVYVLFAVVVVIHAKNYEEYKVYNVVPTSDTQVQILSDLRKSGFDFWDDVVTIGKDVKIMVDPGRNEEFLTYTESVGITVDLRISNVQKLIDDQLQPANDNIQRNNVGNFTWTTYHTLDTIHGWLDELQDLYPDIVSVVTIGTSYEGRPIKGIIINYNRENRGTNPLIAMIEGGIHSREWISPATVTWIIKEFLTSDDDEVRFLAEEFIWHIFPVVNPDGYVYTFSNDRLWRKNRNPANFTTCAGSTDDDLSNGIDLNRNFDFLWMTTGASSNPCSQTYAGPSPASEPETRAISSYVNQLKSDGNLLYYFAFHSFSQMVLVPFSHVSGFDVLLAGNYPDLYEVAIRGAERLEAKHGTPYQVGTSAEILYEVSGSSFDWVKGVADVPIVYLFELRDVGEFGFLLPANQIIPNNEEIMEGLLEMDNTARILGYYESRIVRSSAITTFGSFMSMVISIGFLVLCQ